MIEEQINFYQSLKRDLMKDKTNFVFGSRNNTTDFVVLNPSQNVELYKIVPYSEKEKVSTWISKLKKVYALAWYKAEYNLIYLDEDFKELKRKKLKLLTLITKRVINQKQSLLKSIDSH
mgnify:CR=1 FL=1